MRPPAGRRVGARHEHLPLGHLEIVDAGPAVSRPVMM